VRKVAALTRDCRAANPAERKRVASSCVKSMISSSASQPALRDSIFAFADADHRPTPSTLDSDPRVPVSVKCSFFKEPAPESTVSAPCFCCGNSIRLSDAGWVCLPSAPKPWSPLCPTCHRTFSSDVQTC
jgi:hypothetical protein